MVEEFITIGRTPYSLCGNDGEDFSNCDWIVGEGDHLISAVPTRLGRGRVFPSKTINITVTSSSRVNGVMNFTLINCTTEETVGVVVNGTVIDRARFPEGKWTLQLNTAPKEVGSVKVYVNDRYKRVDNEFPYTLCGKDEKDFDRCRLGDGYHKIKVVAYTKKKR